VKTPFLVITRIDRDKTVHRSTDYSVNSVRKDNTKLSRSCLHSEMASFLPTLSPPDIQRAAQVSARRFTHHSGSPTYQTKLIQESYNPTSSHRLSPDEHRRLQSELYELQRRWEAWGLVVPFLFEHADPNVQFFGAHTAQVKISRDWYAPDTQSMHPRPLLYILTSGRASQPRMAMSSFYFYSTSRDAQFLAVLARSS